MALSRVRERLESMTEQFDALSKLGYFTMPEIKDMIQQRTYHEHRLIAFDVVEEDFLRYIEYEMDLERQRLKRRQTLSVEGKRRGDDIFNSNIFALFMRMCSRSRNSDCWLQCIDWLWSKQDVYHLEKLFRTLLIRNPADERFWILSALFEYELKQSISQARSVLVRGLEMLPDSLDLWCERLRLELDYVEMMIDMVELDGQILVDSEQHLRQQFEAVRREAGEELKEMWVEAEKELGLEATPAATKKSQITQLLASADLDTHQILSHFPEKFPDDVYGKRILFLYRQVRDATVEKQQQAIETRKEVMGGATIEMVLNECFKVAREWECYEALLNVCRDYTRLSKSVSSYIETFAMKHHKDTVAARVYFAYHKDEKETGALLRGASTEVNSWDMKEAYLQFLFQRLPIDFPVYQEAYKQILEEWSHVPQSTVFIAGQLIQLGMGRTAFDILEGGLAQHPQDLSVLQLYYGLGVRLGCVDEVGPLYNYLVSTPSNDPLLWDTYVSFQLSSSPDAASLRTLLTTVLSHLGSRDHGLCARLVRVLPLLCSPAEVDQLILAVLDTPSFHFETAKAVASILTSRRPLLSSQVDGTMQRLVRQFGKSHEELWLMWIQVYVDNKDVARVARIYEQAVQTLKNPTLFLEEIENRKLAQSSH